MLLFEIVFEVTHDCPFGNISRKFPSLKMFVWCNREHEVIEVVVEKPEEYKAVMKEISKMDGLIEEISDGYKIHARANTTSLSSHQRLRHQVFSDIGMRRKSSFSLMC